MKKERLEQEIPIKLDLESIAGLTWLGVLGASAIAALGYQTYNMLHKHLIIDQAYQIASDLTQYIPWINS